MAVRAIALPALKTVNNNSLLGSGNISIAGGSGGITVLAQSGVASSVTGTVNETTLATITIPGGTIGANDSLRITFLWVGAGTAGGKTPKVKLGTTEYYAPVLGSTTNLASPIVIIRNRGSTSSQIGFTPQSASGFGSFNGASSVTSGYDMTADQTITFTGTVASAADTLTLAGYTVEVVK